MNGDSGGPPVSSVTECTSTPWHPCGCVTWLLVPCSLDLRGSQRWNCQVRGRALAPGSWAVCHRAEVGTLCAVWPAHLVCSAHSGCVGPLALGWRRGQSGRLVFTLSFIKASCTPQTSQLDFVICEPLGRVLGTRCGAVVSLGVRGEVTVSLAIPRRRAGTGSWWGGQ